MQNGLFVLNASLATGIKEEALTTFIKVYPNPAVNNLVIQLANYKAGEVTIKLFDLQGRQVMEDNQSIQNNSTILSVNTIDLASGTYFLRLQNNELNYTQKIVIAK
jgi:hypothetical protein